MKTTTAGRAAACSSAATATPLLLTESLLGMGCVALLSDLVMLAPVLVALVALDREDWHWALACALMVLVSVLARLRISAAALCGGLAFSECGAEWTLCWLDCMSSAGFLMYGFGGTSMWMLDDSEAWATAVAECGWLWLMCAHVAIVMVALSEQDETVGATMGQWMLRMCNCAARGGGFALLAWRLWEVAQYHACIDELVCLSSGRC